MVLVELIYVEQNLMAVLQESLSVVKTKLLEQASQVSASEVKVLQFLMLAEFARGLQLFPWRKYPLSHSLHVDVEAEPE